MRTVNFTDVRSNLKNVLDTVAADHTITIITRRDSEDAVIMSMSDYNSIQETLYLFGTQANAERLHAAMAEADDSLPAGARILVPKDREVASATGTAAARSRGIKALTRKQKLLLKEQVATKPAKGPATACANASAKRKA
ncbi:MAG: type II toxin-antitoxin system Phd/YefM family antitoxin [Rhodanobacter sp.]|nr:MAG: type II toxin-antitoxin system Phd/YefM family antitoxin [Rhodanobacter sp.]TAM40212.1 MAG: type II toxin-antitoxin system Phd/YefM family antitoxin [Rhodanobacter sp.]